MSYSEARKPPLAVLLLLTVLGSTLVLSPPPVLAQVGCGSMITTSTTLTASIGPCSGNGLVIGANGIALNCAGYTVSGTAQHVGITLTKMTGVTVENCKITGFQDGLLLSDSSRDTLSGNTATSNVHGFVLSSSSDNNTLTKNTASRNHWGFDLGRSSLNTLTTNTANSNLWGFYLSSSYHNTLTTNTANSNYWSGFGLYGSSNNTLTGNTASTDHWVGFHLSSSSSNTLTGNTADNSIYGGFSLYSSSNNTLAKNVADKNGWGFLLSSSSNKNTLTENTANGNSQNAANINGYGFFLISSSSNTLTRNTATANTYGFALFSSSNDALARNTADSNQQYGYYDDSTGSGTAGTANLYTGDECYGNGAGGSSPGGLCTLQHISLSPSSGLVGISVTVSGLGFAASHSLTVTYDSSTAGMPTTCTTKASGSMNSGCTFKVPSSVLGIHTVTVSDGVHSPTSTFTVLRVTVSTVSCIPASVVVGSATTCKVTVKGSGSAPTGTVVWSTSGKGKFSSTSCKLSGQGSAGTCSVKYTPTAAGSPVIITAKYGGDAKNAQSHGTRSLTVVKKV